KGEDLPRGAAGQGVEAAAVNVFEGEKSLAVRGEPKVDDGRQAGVEEPLQGGHRPHEALRLFRRTVPRDELQGDRLACRRVEGAKDARRPLRAQGLLDAVALRDLAKVGHQSGFGSADSAPPIVSENDEALLEGFENLKMKKRRLRTRSRVSASGRKGGLA